VNRWAIRLLIFGSACQRVLGASSVRSPRACDEYVDETPGALFPARRSRGGVEDADERAEEVVGIGVRAQIAAAMARLTDVTKTV
jgi:hypothetical protein